MRVHRCQLDRIIRARKEHATIVDNLPASIFLLG
jgi:hypothetical protein